MLVCACVRARVDALAYMCTFAVAYMPRVRAYARPRARACVRVITRTSAKCVGIIPSASVLYSVLRAGHNTETKFAARVLAGISLLGVAVHEIGHVIGIRHSRLSAAIMFPLFKRWRGGLYSDDIAAVQLLYGESTRK